MKRGFIANTDLGWLSHILRRAKSVCPPPVTTKNCEMDFVPEECSPGGPSVAPADRRRT